MAIQSMTGFARSDGALGPARWHWEVRSVNNRGLDLRLRLAPGCEALEALVREGVSKRLTRGSVSVSLSLAGETRPASVRVNAAALAEVRAAAEGLSRALGGPPPTAEGLLALKGVLEIGDEIESEAAVAARNAAMLASLDRALDGVAGARAAEGARLRSVLEAQLAEIARLVDLIAASPMRTPEAVRRRLGELIARLVETGQGLDPARLHQEAVLIATRADVEEELKRLRMHVESARELLGAEGAAGRKLEFISQELNREANTLTSKAADGEIARHGLALKVVIDQMREQVQNIE